MFRQHFHMFAPCKSDKTINLCEGIARLTTAFCVASLNTPAIASQNKVASATDFASVLKAHQVKIAPSGKYAALELHVPGPPKSKNWLSRRTIWLTSLDETNSTIRWDQPLQDFHQSWAPEWSPDGTKLAFLATPTGRKEQAETNQAPQLFVARFDGSKPEQLTHLKQGVNLYQWAPNSKTIALTTTSQNNTPETRNKASTNTNKLLAVDTKSQQTQLLYKGKDSINNFSWYPDSTTMAVTKSPTDSAQDQYANQAIAVIDTKTGHTKKSYTNILHNWPYFKLSPNGKKILYGENTKTGIARNAAILDTTTGENSIIPIPKGTLIDGEWLQNSNSIIAKILRGNKLYLSKIDLNTKEITTITEATSDWNAGGQSFAIDSTGKRLIYLKETPTSPADVWIRNDNKSTKITNLNPQIKKLKLHPIKDIKWQNSSDKQWIHGMLILPDRNNPNQRLPLITVIHGGPYWAWWNGWQEGYMGWGQYLASHGYAVFLPNQRGSMGAGADYADAIAGDIGGIDFQDVMDGIDALLDSENLDPERLGIGGFSYGGFMTSWAISQTDRFKAAVAGGLIANWSSMYETTDIPKFVTDILGVTPTSRDTVFRKYSPVYQVSKQTTPTLLYQGVEDQRTPIGQAEEMKDALLESGTISKLIPFEGENHYFRDHSNTVILMEEILAWFNHYLKPSPLERR